MDALDWLNAHVTGLIGQRARMAGRERTAELVGLVVRHWPHNHLDAIQRAGGKNHVAVRHAMALVRAQVREHYEARHGVGPLWNLFLAGFVASISQAVVELWFGDASWRVILRGLSRQIAAGDLPKKSQE
jgi:hypothetical protein